MTINCMGRVNVPTPGTPVPLSTDPTVTASKLFFQVIPGLTGKTYVGTPTMTKATLAGYGAHSLAKLRGRLFRNLLTSNRRMARIPSASPTTRSMPMSRAKVCSSPTGQSRRKAGPISGGLNICFPDLHLRHFHGFGFSCERLPASSRRYRSPYFRPTDSARRTAPNRSERHDPSARDIPQKLFSCTKSASIPIAIQLLAAHHHLHPVIVPMHVLALAFVMAQRVTRGECVFYGNFKHRKNSPLPRNPWKTRSPADYRKIPVRIVAS